VRGAGAAGLQVKAGRRNHPSDDHPEKRNMVTISQHISQRNAPQ
jgi:hypothetical protein